MNIPMWLIIVAPIAAFLLGFMTAIYLSNIAVARVVGRHLGW